MGERQPRGDRQRKQRTKNVALMVALFAFAAVVYLVTIVRLGGQ